MDSTGVKFYGEGEWKVRMHGVSKRRTWRKLHVGANPEDGEIQAVILTENNVSDDQAVDKLLGQIEQTIIDFAADGAYDKRKVYDSLNTHSPAVGRLKKGAIVSQVSSTTKYTHKQNSLKSFIIDASSSVLGFFEQKLPYHA